MGSWREIFRSPKKVAILVAIVTVIAVSGLAIAVAKAYADAIWVMIVPLGVVFAFWWMIRGKPH